MMWASPVSTVSWEFIASKLEFSSSFIVPAAGSAAIPCAAAAATCACPAGDRDSLASCPNPGHAAWPCCGCWAHTSSRQGTIWKPNSFLGQEDRAVAALTDPTLPLRAAIAALREQNL